ncbi:MAG: GNAT family N-acetyltransferase [Chloroflexota bacterium]
MNSRVAGTVREARPEDLDAVATLFLACWRTSYAGFLPAQVIGMYDDDSARALWRPTLNDPPADPVVFVVERAAGDVLGVVRIGTDPEEPASGHVYSLYVHPEMQGHGLGARLLAAADNRFRRDGRDVATLWVFAANDGAQRFYARLGWQPDGGQRVEPQYGEPELRLRRTYRDGVANGGPA